MMRIPFLGVPSRKWRIGLEVTILSLILLTIGLISFRGQTEQAFFTVEQIDIKHSHNIHYDPEKNHFVSVGEDPWIVIGEENQSFAVVDVIAVFKNAVDVGAFPAYYIPFNRREYDFKENWKITSNVEKTGNGIKLHWQFPRPIASFRIDPFPTSSFTLDGVEVNYRTISQVWVILWSALIFYIIVRFTHFWGNVACKKYNQETAFWIGIAVLVAIKIWLVQGQALAAYFGAGHDDHLFIRLGNSILDGLWLGSYNEVTLIKGPMYPIWIAVSFIIGIPLLLGQQLFYIGACIIWIYILKKNVSSYAFLISAFIVLVFNPGTYDISQARVLRGGIYTSLTLWVIVFLFAIYNYRTESLRRLSALAICLGLGMSAFWLTREEGIWLLPSIALIIIFIVYDLWLMDSNDLWKRILAICLIPMGILSVSILSVSTINYYKYGVFCTVEMKSEPFKSAYGALSRVSPHRHLPYVPVPKDTRLEIYDVSPSFAKLKPFLEGEIGKGWASNSVYLTGFAPDEREIAGGWFMWALRDAAARAGFHTSGKEAMRYYSQIAEEVNAACKSGAVQCGPKRASLVPPLRMEYATTLLQRFPETLFATASFQRILVFPQNSMFFPQKLQRRPFAEFEDLTLETVAPQLGGPIYLPNQHNINSIKMNFLQSLSDLYKVIMTIFVVVLILSYFYCLFYRAINKKISFFLVLNTALVIAVIFRLLILMLIDTTSFPAVNSQYLAPIYPLILILVATSLADGYAVFETIRKKGAISEINGDDVVLSEW